MSDWRHGSSAVSTRHCSAAETVPKCETPSRRLLGSLTGETTPCNTEHKGAFCAQRQSAPRWKPGRGGRLLGAKGARSTSRPFPISRAWTGLSSASPLPASLHHLTLKGGPDGGVSTWRRPSPDPGPGDYRQFPVQGCGEGSEPPAAGFPVSRARKRLKRCVPWAAASASPSRTRPTCSCRKVARSSSRPASGSPSAGASGYVNPST